MQSPLIEIQRIDDDVWWAQLTSTDRGGRYATNHRVRVTPDDMWRHGVGPDSLIEATLRFLLEHLPQQHIHREFDLGAMAFYFPGFEQGVTDLLAAESH